MPEPSRRNFLRTGAVLAAVPAAMEMSRPQTANAETSPPSGGRSNDSLTTVDVGSYGASGSDYHTTGSVTAGSTRLTVADAGDFRPGQGIYVVGAGRQGTALVTAVAHTDGDVLILADPASTSVANAAIQHDDTAAIGRAFKALGSPPQGRLGFPEGAYRISSTLDFDLGHPNASQNWPQPTPGIGWFELAMVGHLRPIPGIGTAMRIHSGHFPAIQVKLEGAGTEHETDEGLVLNDLLGARIALDAKYFAGTALHIHGPGPGAPTKVAISSVERLITIGCGRALILDGTDGFGLISYVWDGYSTHGSLIRNANDVSIGHWENYAPGTQEVSLDFQACGAIHLGRIALGDSASVMMRIQDCIGVSIDKFYGLSGQGIGTTGELASRYSIQRSPLRTHSRSTSRPGFT